MFATLKEVRAMVADAFDLAIEFATLGEYRLPASDGAAPPADAYPSFEGLPVRGCACPATAGDRVRRGAPERPERRSAAPMGAAVVRRERRRSPRPVASARP